MNSNIIDRVNSLLTRTFKSLINLWEIVYMVYLDNQTDLDNLFLDSFC